MLSTLRNWIYRSKTGVQQIIFVCIMVFVPAWLLSAFDVTGPLYWLTFSPSVWFKPWTCISYMFLHTGFWHLVGNMMWLFFVGSILEDLVGKRPIYWLFIGGGFFGAMVFQAVYSFSWYSERGILMQLLGASGGVSAVVIGTAVFTPKYRLFLFGLVEVELRWIALIKVVLDFVGVASGSNVGGYTAHLGGVCWGLIYVMGTLKGDFLQNTIAHASKISGGLGSIFDKKLSKKVPLRFEKGEKSVASTNAKKGNNPSESEVNAVLDKISQMGYSNLSAKEKEILFKASKSD